LPLPAAALIFEISLSGVQVVIIASSRRNSANTACAARAAPGSSSDQIVTWTTVPIAWSVWTSLRSGAAVG
jgi:hypothetical protein